MRRPELRVSEGTFRANIAAVRRRMAPSSLMLVLKDDAYGHGLDWAVRAAENSGVDLFGSYDVRSALAVRRVIEGDARIFAWATSTDAEIDEALLSRIDLGVGTMEYLRRIVARAQVLGVAARIHLKIDTGLHRNGILADDWAAAVAMVRAAERAGLIDLKGVWSHIAEASDAEDDTAQAAFLRAVHTVGESGAMPEALHLTASAASWWRPELRGTVSRVGAFCYGVRSADGPELEGIRPAASLVAFVAGIEGDQARIGIGSFDGLPSTLAGATVGTSNGPVTLTSVGFTDSSVNCWPGARVGDEVVLFGPGAHGESSATTLAERIDTVGEEILTRLTPYVRRVAVD